MKITLNGLEKAQGMVIRVTEAGVEIDCAAVATVPAEAEERPASMDQEPIDVSTPEARAKAASQELTAYFAAASGSTKDSS